MVMRVVALLLVICLLLGSWADVSYATTLNMSTTDGLRFVLTTGPGGGLSKINTAVQKVQRGLGIARSLGALIGPIAVGLAILDVATGVWDWVTRYYADQASDSALPSQYAIGACWNPPGSFTLYSVSGRCVSNIQQAVVKKWVTGLSQYCDDGTSLGGGLGSYSVVGTSVSYSDAGSCTMWHQSVFYEDTTTATDRSPVLNDTPQTAPSDSNQAVVNALLAAKAALMDRVQSGAYGEPLPSSSTSTGSLWDQIRALDDAISVLTTGVPLSSPADFSQGSTWSNPQGPKPLASTATGTGASVAVDMGPTNNRLDTVSSKLDATPSNAPAQTCPDCLREDKWAQFWDTLRAAGQSAPVFGLISKLVINPLGGQSVCAVRTISTSMMGSLTVDPGTWNCSTLVAVFRFAILGTCIIVAYMILFG